MRTLFLLVPLLFMLPGCGNQKGVLLPTSDAAREAAAAPTAAVKINPPPLPGKPAK